MSESLFSFRVLRYLAFVVFFPVYGVGYFGYMLMCGAADAYIVEDWPIEARCLLGFTAPVALPLGLISLLLYCAWDAVNE